MLQVLADPALLVFIALEPEQAVFLEEQVLVVPALLVFIALDPEHFFLAAHDLVVPALLVFMALEPEHCFLAEHAFLVVPALLVFMALEPVQAFLEAVHVFAEPALLVFIALEPLEAQHAFLALPEQDLVDFTAAFVAGAASFCADKLVDIMMPPTNKAHTAKTLVSFFIIFIVKGSEIVNCSTNINELNGSTKRDKAISFPFAKKGRCFDNNSLTLHLWEQFLPRLNCQLHLHNVFVTRINGRLQLVQQKEESKESSVDIDRVF